MPIWRSVERGDGKIEKGELTAAIGIFAEWILHRAAHDRVAEQRDIDHDADAQRRRDNADHCRIFANDRRKRVAERLKHRGKNMIAEIHIGLQFPLCCVHFVS